MKTVQIKGFVHYRKCPYTGEETHTMYGCDMSGTQGFGPCMGEASFDYVVPADFNPIKVEVAGIEKQMANAEEAHQSAMKAMRDRIANLLCIECELA